MKTKSYRFLAPIVLLLGLFSCHRSERCWVEINGAVWNTIYSIKYEGTENLVDSIHLVLREVEMSLSPFNSQSKISAVNRGESAEVDSNITAVFRVSQYVNRLSGGAFDPTLSPLINLWGFGYESNDCHEPTSEMIDSVKRTVGIDSCYIANGKLYKKHHDTTFNFSAVTKGFGCDKVAEILRRNGADNYLIEIGGEIALGGVNDRRKPWRVMIDAPDEEMTPGQQGLVTIEPGSGGVATSGNYRNYRDLGNGQKLGHTINAFTGRPVETNTLSVTIKAGDCATADALATACMAMHPDSAISMVSRLEGVQVLLVTLQPDSTFSIYSTFSR